jgi:AcrR family transcriptional regulator
MALSAGWHPVPPTCHTRGVGLREAKREATARTLVSTALRLFRDRRFADVSVDEIAAASNVARRTFFRYFPTKEDLILDRRLVDREYAVAEIRSRVPGEDDVTVVMRVVAELQRRTFARFGPEDQPEVYRLTHAEPELAARSWLLTELVRNAIVEGLVSADAGPSELLRARLLAGACVMVVDSAATTWIETGMRTDLSSLVGEGAQQLRVGFAGQILHQRTVSRDPIAPPGGRAQVIATDPPRGASPRVR